MPLNLIKKYNALLELNGLNEKERKQSLRNIFSRDFEEKTVVFKGKNVTPTPVDDGKIAMETLFHHLITKVENEELKNRVFDKDRAERLHWIRYHLELKKEGVLVFSTQEKQQKRTYIYDQDEQYVIVLEPFKNGKSYYLLTAYKLKGKDSKRDKIMKKYKRKLPDLL
ncbi:MAG: hypothetical protein Q4A09_02785 [Capnocytophaga felis]|nr:hypothetical protein [Capnocytophaga felis]